MSETEKTLKPGIRTSSAKQRTLLAVFTLLIALFVILLSARCTPKEGKIIGYGDRAPGFSLQALDGKTVSLADFRGKVILVHFWATWCPPCVEEMPALEQFARSIRAKDFQILAVSVDEGGAAAVAAFMQKNGLSIPVLLDPSRSIAKLYGTFKFPETYVIDRQGVVRDKAIGPRDWTVPSNTSIIRQLLEAG
ncbi:MAG TPA: TlpA disulfide reductase family protein [Nitrospirota bacterium]|nr:TlpA disulfide reductase family protein [Nitrospirota bacterium]